MNTSKKKQSVPVKTASKEVEPMSTLTIKMPRSKHLEIRSKCMARGERPSDRCLAALDYSFDDPVADKTVSAKVPKRIKPAKLSGRWPE